MFACFWQTQNHLNKLIVFFLFVLRKIMCVICVFEHSIESSSQHNEIVLILKQHNGTKSRQKRWPTSNYAMKILISNSQWIAIYGNVMEFYVPRFICVLTFCFVLFCLIHFVAYNNRCSHSIIFALELFIGSIWNDYLSVHLPCVGALSYLFLLYIINGFNINSK